MFRVLYRGGRLYLYMASNLMLDPRPLTQLYAFGRAAVVVVVSKGDHRREPERHAHHPLLGCDIAHLVDIDKILDMSGRLA